MPGSRRLGGVAAWIAALALLAQSILAAAHFHSLDMPAHQAEAGIALLGHDVRPDGPAHPEDDVPCGFCIFLQIAAGGEPPLAALLATDDASKAAGTGFVALSLGMAAYSRPFGRGPPETT